MLIPRNNQPQQAAQINPYWLAKGLVFADYGNGIVWTKAAGNKVPTSKTGTKLIGGKYGLSTAYGTSVGVATTDIQNIQSCTITNGPLSMVGFGYALTAGGGGLGRIFQPFGDAGNVSATAMYFVLSAVFAFNRYATTLGQWGVLGSGPILNRWVTYGVTHNPQGVVSTKPDMYVDGILRTDTNVPANPSGTYPASTTFQVSRGNRSTDGTRYWDGYLGPLFIFNGILTSSDHASLSANPWQIFMPSERIYTNTVAPTSVERRPLVMIDGVMQELPVGHLLVGMPFSGTFSFTSTGTTVVDFGAGSSIASTTLNAIGLTDKSYCVAQINPELIIANGITHTANDHKYAAAFISIKCINIGVNNGVTIVATSPYNLTGQFSIKFTAI